MFNTKLFAERLKSARMEKRISQADLAKAVGVSAATISSYETPSGAKVPSLDKAAAIASHLEISLDWLCGKESAGKVKITNFDAETYLRSLIVVITEMTNTFEEYPKSDKGNILLNNRRVVYFLKQCVDLLKVYRNGTLTKELYETCVEKIISNYSDYSIAYDNFLSSAESEAADNSVWHILDSENFNVGPGVFKTSIDGYGYDFASRDFEGFLSEETINAMIPYTDEDKGGD